MSSYSFGNVEETDSPKGIHLNKLSVVIPFFGSAATGMKTFWKRSLDYSAGTRISSNIAWKLIQALLVAALPVDLPW